MPLDPADAARVRALLADRDDVTERRMMGGFVFMVGGHMCCGVSGRGLMVRVGPEGIAAALALPHTGPMMIGTNPTAGFVRVAIEGYRSAADLNAWVRRGLAFVATLPAKRDR